ncbi:jg1186 [Pararge aegeria aegeria]|uniref:Jg1186 protein n=1 Tax=Pararge aegeria aegeria TaxID=348720 RepID=A0A8S4RBP3_9NEOP|nr:jg1186 [Pararge aegeria aegeria]
MKSWRPAQAVWEFAWADAASWITNHDVANAEESAAVLGGGQCFLGDLDSGVTIDRNRSHDTRDQANLSRKQKKKKKGCCNLKLRFF